jgi:hypothetical protein
MQNGDHTGLGTQVIGVFCKAVYSLPCCLEKAVIDGLGLIHCQLIQRVRQREHYVEVGYGKQLGLPVSQPLFPVFTLAFWAVPIAAAVIADPCISAFGTGIQMPSQVGGATTSECRKGAQLPAVDVRVVFYL